MIYCNIAINFHKWKKIKNIESLINSTTSLIIGNLDLKKYQSKKHDLEIFFNLVGKQKMKKINYQFLGKNYPTNVLSFANLDENLIRKIGLKKIIEQYQNLILGDIVLDYQTIEQEAIQQNKNFIDHLTHLIVHAILHLIGHDHQQKKMAKEMERLEIKILKKLLIKNPYDI